MKKINMILVAILLFAGLNVPKAMAVGEVDFWSSVNGISVHGYTRVYYKGTFHQGTHVTSLPTRFNTVTVTAYLYNGSNDARLDYDYCSDGDDGASDGKVYCYTTASASKTWGRSLHYASSATDSTSGQSFDYTSEQR